MTTSDISYILVTRSLLVDHSVRALRSLPPSSLPADLAPAPAPVPPPAPDTPSSAAPHQQKRNNQWTVRRQRAEAAAAAAGVPYVHTTPSGGRARDRERDRGDHSGHTNASLAGSSSSQPHVIDPHADPTNVDLPARYQIKFNRQVVREYVAKWEAKGWASAKSDRLKWSPFLVKGGLWVGEGAQGLQEKDDAAAAVVAAAGETSAAVVAGEGDGVPPVAGPSGVRWEEVAQAEKENEQAVEATVSTSEEVDPTDKGKGKEVEVEKEDEPSGAEERDGFVFGPIVGTLPPPLPEPLHPAPAPITNGHHSSQPNGHAPHPPLANGLGLADPGKNHHAHPVRPSKLIHSTSALDFEDDDEEEDSDDVGAGRSPDEDFDVASEEPSDDDDDDDGPRFRVDSEEEDDFGDRSGGRQRSRGQRASSRRQTLPRAVSTSSRPLRPRRSTAALSSHPDDTPNSSSRRSTRGSGAAPPVELPVFTRRRRSSSGRLVYPVNGLGASASAPELEGSPELGIAPSTTTNGDAASTEGSPELVGEQVGSKSVIPASPSVSPELGLDSMDVDAEGEDDVDAEGEVDEEMVVTVG